MEGVPDGWSDPVVRNVGRRLWPKFGFGGRGEERSSLRRRVPPVKVCGYPLVLPGVKEYLRWHPQVMECNADVDVVPRRSGDLSSRAGLCVGVEGVYSLGVDVGAGGAVPVGGPVRSDRRAADVTVLCGDD